MTYVPFLFIKVGEIMLMILHGRNTTHFCKHLITVLCTVHVSTGSSALDLFECYDTRTESWQVKTSMLMARCSHGSVEANGLIYVCGGTVGNNVSGRVLNNCEVYDPNTQQ